MTQTKNKKKSRTTILREEFVTALQSVSVGLSALDVAERSSCFTFLNGRVHTFNEEVACSTPSLLEESVQGALKAKPLAELLQKIPDEEIAVYQQDGKLHIRASKHRGGRFPLDSNVVPPVHATLTPADSWLPLHDDFSEAVSTVANCAEKSSSKFTAACCVHIHPKWVEAFSDSQLCRWRMKTGFKNSLLIRESALKGIGNLGMNEFSEGESWVHFRNPVGMILSCRRYIDPFPDLSEHLDIEGTTTAIPKGLEEVIARAEVLSRDNAGDNRVLVQFAEGKLTVVGAGTYGEWIESVETDYSGESLCFYATPEILADITKKHNEMVVSPTRLMIETDSYVYLAVLSPANTDNDEEGNEE